MNQLLRLSKWESAFDEEIFAPVDNVTQEFAPPSISPKLEVANPSITDCERSKISSSSNYINVVKKCVQ